MPPILPPALRFWTDPLAPALQKLFIPTDVIHGLDRARRSQNSEQFATRLLESLEIHFTVESDDVMRVPATGPGILVANHPYGILEGLILMSLLSSVRNDSKLLANSWLGWIPELRGQTILVNPFETRAAQIENRAPLRSALRWLASGGLLTVFPAGEVAHVQWKEQSVTDPPWKTSAVRLALRARCSVMPVFFEGSNSIPFQVAGILHPGLRTMGLAREFSKMRGRTVRLRIGSPIPHSLLAGYRDVEQATAYARCRTFFLANRSTAAHAPRLARTSQSGAVPTKTSGEMERAISAEVASLPPECEIAADKNFCVYLAKSEQIPIVLPEIGRCRELAFRKAGEGTGMEVDLDGFDRYYQHLFLWNKTDLQIAGAYRLAVTDDVLPRYGIEGLYTSTLFRYRQDFFDRVGPAFELGRSFVMPQYQRNYAALLLLWKGITRVALRRPEAPVLFGAVSISREYSAFSRSLITTYLAGRASHELAHLVEPRRRFRHPSLRTPQIKRFAEVAADIEDLSHSVADIEEDGKGVPVLIRQYLKAGGRVLAFSVDPQFSGTLDALMLADLRHAPQALLDRCMGRAEAQAFHAGHKLG